MAAGQRQGVMPGVWARFRTAARSDSVSHDAGLRRVGTRLALQTVGLVLVMLVVLEGVVYLITQQTLLGSLETNLQQRSNPPTDFVRGILRLGGPASGQPPQQNSPGGGRFPGGIDDRGFRGPNPDLVPSDVSSAFVNSRLSIVHSDGALGNVVLDPQALRRVLSTGRKECCSVTRYRQQEYLVATNPLMVGGLVAGAVQSSISEHQYEDTMKSLLETLLIVALLGLVGSGAVSLVLVRRALRPIRTAIQRQRDFVADAAHELRTPLAIQRTVAEVGLGGDADEHPEMLVEQMLVENKHLTRLVDDLSLLARADSQAVSITPTPMNLSSLVTETVQEIEPLAEERGMHLVAHPETNVWVLGDVMRLRQLLLVLLDNALKYTPPGGSLEVSLDTVRDRAQLQVRDSGPGIPPADLPRIFDRFYRANKARTGEGSGLGLAIAKWIVEAHGGQLRADNTAPHGAIFTAMLPTTRAKATT